MNEPEKKLVKLLRTIAGYNDKGYAWYNHSPAESEALRAKWRRELDGLTAEIGENNFSAGLLEELYQPAVLQDGSGLYVQKASEWFSRGKLNQGR